MSEKRTRQEVYDRIREGTKDKFILEDMKRLGFWSANQPTLAENLIVKEAELQRELKDLLSKVNKFENSDKMLSDMRKERMKAAKLKRQETKENNKKIREEKAQNWNISKNSDIVYLGENVSKGLINKTINVDNLQKFNLPIFEDVSQLAKSLGLTLSELKYLAFNRKVAKSSHYYLFSIPKKSGGFRRISAPKTKLKNVQNWLNENLLSKINHNDNAHGFIKNKSILTNAEPHLNQEVVINLDLKDFFPTITYARIKGMFENFGYSEQIAITLALICSHAHTEIVELDRVKYYVQKGERHLPQGSPASPAISNIICYRLDKRLTKLAEKYGFAYTRYADDLTFSGNEQASENISKLLKYVKTIIADEKFVVNEEKTTMMRKHQQQKVTGIVVNQKPNVSRDRLRKFRALLHNIEKNGWQDQKWGKAKHLINAIDGYICFVKMVNPSKAEVFREQLQAIIAKHGAPISSLGFQPKEKLSGFQPDQSSLGFQPEENFSSWKPEEKDWWDLF